MVSPSYEQFGHCACCVCCIFVSCNLGWMSSFKEYCMY